MANITMKDGTWKDLGRFKSVKCVKIMNKQICGIKFTDGEFVISETELKKICKKA